MEETKKVERKKKNQSVLLGSTCIPGDWRREKGGATANFMLQRWGQDWGTGIEEEEGKLRLPIFAWPLWRVGSQGVSGGVGDRSKGLYAPSCYSPSFVVVA